MSLVPEDRLAVRVGAIAIVVLAAAIAGSVFLLGGTALGAPTRIRVVFRHAAGLREQAALVVAGQPVGRIEAIVPVPHGAAGLLAGEVGVAVTIAVDRGSAWKVPANGDIFIASRGPLSDRYLEVAPPAGDPGPAIHDGQELRGIDPPSLDNVLERAWLHLTVFKAFVETVRPELDALMAQLGELAGQVSRLADEAGGGALVAQVRALGGAARQTYQTSLGGDAELAQLRATIGDARREVARLRAALDRLAPRGDAVVAAIARIRGHVAALRAERAIDAMRAALAMVDPLLGRLEELGARIASGEGSLGRLMADPEFADDAKDLGKIMKRHPWRILERPKD